MLQCRLLSPEPEYDYLNSVDTNYTYQKPAYPIPPDDLFEAVILFIGETGAGKSTLINNIAGGRITATDGIQEYTCNYQDKDTHLTWKLRLLDTPELGDINGPWFCKDVDAFNTMKENLKIEDLSDSISGIIYCHRINQHQSRRLASRLTRIKAICEGHAMKNIIFCTTQWDMLVDKDVGECEFQRLIKDYSEVYWARYDNTRKSVEEMLGLIVGKEMAIPILLKELERPQMTFTAKMAFRKNHEEIEQLLPEIRSMRIKAVVDRAKIKEEHEESHWHQKLAHMSAELDTVKTNQEKEVIERRIEKERQNQEWKRKMWKAIRGAWEEYMKKDGDPELHRRFSEAAGLKLIANQSAADSEEVGDTLVSGMKSLKRSLPADMIGIEEQKLGSLSVVGSGTHNSHVDDMNDKHRDDFVPLQIKPFAGKYAITPELASKTFDRADVELLLVALNRIFHTIIPISYPGIRKTLEYLINKGYDLGAIYAHMRVIWPIPNEPSILPKRFTDNNSDYVIGSPELVFRKCQDIDELLSFLNMSFDTEIPWSKPGVEEVLGFLVNQGYEFGDICARMHCVWPRTPELEREWLKIWELEWMNLKVWEDFLTNEKRGKDYEDQRQKSLHHDTIHAPDLIQPRRIWDLYAHRVIPFEFSAIAVNNNNYNSSVARPVPTRLSLRFGSTRFGRYHPVSHSWTEDMSPVESPINAYEWPIPLPRGVTLEAVRNELLNLGAQYVWLDVVCLRQESSDSARETLRMKEWKIDVPTIGRIYKASPSVDNVIRYLNGLGKAFRRYGWYDKRHWSQRAWTLQEVNGEYIEAGLPKGVEDPLEETDENGTKLRDHLSPRQIRLPFQPGQGFGQIDLHSAIAAMKGRHSQNPVDKIFGLSALLECRVLLAYSENEQEEDAWTRLLRHVNSRTWAELLFAFSLPGENGCHWRPSWKQLMADTSVIEKVAPFPLAWSKLLGDGHLSCRIALIKGCQVSFDCPSASTVVIQTERKGKKYEWTMINPNSHVPIGPGIIYTLAGDHIRPSLHWVLCKSYLHGELEKVSVLRRSPDEIQGLDLIGTNLDGLLAGCSDVMCSEEVIFR